MVWFFLIKDDLQDDDLRNPKYQTDEVGYSKHCYNFGDQKRIYYIKQKKQMQKEEAASRELSKKTANEETIETTTKKNKKKK